MLFFKKKQNVITPKPEKPELDIYNSRQHLIDIFKQRPYEWDPYRRDYWEGMYYYETPSGKHVRMTEFDNYEDERKIYHFLRGDVFNTGKRNSIFISMTEIIKSIKSVLNIDVDTDTMVGIIYSVMTQTGQWEPASHGLNFIKISLYTDNKERYYVYPVITSKEFHDIIAQRNYEKYREKQTFTYTELKKVMYSYPKMSGIYMITNTKANKSYVGQAIDIMSRFQSHIASYSKGTTKFYKALQQDGIENCVFTILEECPVIFLDLKEYEYIGMYQTNLNGYNSNQGNKEKALATQEFLKQYSIVPKN